MWHFFYLYKVALVINKFLVQKRLKNVYNDIICKKKDAYMRISNAVKKFRADMNYIDINMIDKIDWINE